MIVINGGDFVKNQQTTPESAGSVWPSSTLQPSAGDYPRVEMFLCLLEGFETLLCARFGLQGRRDMKFALKLENGESMMGVFE